MVPTGNPIVSIFTIGMVLNMVIWHWWLLFTTCLKEARREKWNWCTLFVFVSWNYQLHPVTCSSCITCKNRGIFCLARERIWNWVLSFWSMCCCYWRVWLPPQKGDAGGLLHTASSVCSAAPLPDHCTPRQLVKDSDLILNVWLPTDRAKNSHNSSKIPWSMFYCTSLLTSITEVKTAVKEKWKRWYCTGAMTTLPDNTSHFCRNKWAWGLVITEPEESRVFLSCITFLYPGTAV